MSLLVDPMVSILIGLVKKAAGATESASESTDLSELRKEEARQEFEMRMAERQAKAYQEIAIAERIRLAEEVEIEEYYDLSAEGNAGLTVKEGETGLGLSGKGTRVSKRVYRFIGLNTNSVEKIQAEIIVQSKDLT